MKTNFAIILPTYYRGKDTFEILKRCLDSVFNQTYTNFKIFLVGDNFTEDESLEALLSTYDKDKIEFINLPLAVERIKYKDNKWALWCAGGINARNYTINHALLQGYSWVCSIDHDDYWESNHLYELAKAIDKFSPDVVFTRANWKNETELPKIPTKTKYTKLLPVPEGTVHSSICLNFTKLPFRYVDIFEVTNKFFPADAFLLMSIVRYAKQHEIKSIFINELTCQHPDEGFVRK